MLSQYWPVSFSFESFNKASAKEIDSRNVLNVPSQRKLLLVREQRHWKKREKRNVEYYKNVIPFSGHKCSGFFYIRSTSLDKVIFRKYFPMFLVLFLKMFVCEYKLHAYFILFCLRKVRNVYIKPLQNDHCSNTFK